MQDSINPKTEGLVINLRATNPIVDAVRSTPTQSQNIDVNKLFGERTSTHFTNTSILDTHEKLFDGTWVPKYENFDPTKSTQENAERLAQSQSKGDKWANGWTKFFGKVGSSFAGGTVGTVRGLGEFMSTGSIEAIYDNDFSKRLSDFDTKLTYNNPNHKTQEEQDMNFLQAMTTANWWADDFLGGLSFTVGTVLSEGAWALATGGSSLAVTGAKLGANLAGRTMLKKGIKSLVKPTFKKTLTIGDDLAEAAVNTSIGANVRGGLLGGRAGEALNTARFTMTSAGWESSFESLSYLKEGLQSFDSNFYADNGRMPTSEERQDYINRLYDGANTVFGGNMMLVGASNLAIMGKWFNIGKPSFASSLDKSLKRRLFGVGLDKTGKSVIEATRAQRIAGGLYSWLKPAVTEGVWEEGGQSVLSKAISDYVYAPFNPEYNNTSISMVEAFAEGFDETFTTKDGWKEVWTGMLIGVVGDKGGNMISGRGLKSGVTQMREEAKKMAEFNKSYSIDNLTESLFYANRVQNSNEDPNTNSPEVLALKRREASLGQLTQAHNTGMYEDIVDDTITGLSLIDSNTMADELGVSVEEANTMKKEAIESYKSLAKEYKRNRDFVEYYFGENIKGEKPIQSRLKKDAIAFIMTNGQESYNESREVLNQLKDRLIATVPGVDVNGILNVSDVLAHATDQNKESFAKLTNELDSVMAEIDSVTNEIANLSTKERPNVIDSNLIADEANTLTEKLNELNTKKQTIEAEANRILSASALSNPYYKEQDGVQYISAEDIVKLDDSLKDLESRLQDSFEDLESKESLTELFYAYKDHLRAFKEYAEVSRGIASGKLDLNSKKSLIGKILGNKKYSEEEKRFLKAVSERVSVNVMDYLGNVMGINKAVKNAEEVVETPTEQVEENEQTKTALQRIIDNNTFLREKYGEDTLQALISQQVVEEFENLMLKANGDKSFNGKYENISTNTSLTAEEKGRLEELMEMYGTLAIGEGFSEQGVTLMDVLTQINQNKIVPASEKETLTVSDFSELMTDESEDADGVRNEEVTQTPMNVQVSKRGSTLVVHNLTLKGLLGKLGVAVVDNRTANRTNRGVSVEELSNDKGTRIRFELGGSVLNAFVNNRGAVEITAENRGDNVLSIISNNSNLTSVKYAYGTNTKYSFLFEDGKPMSSDFQVTPRFSEQAIYDLDGGEYVRFEVDINDPYNQSIQDLPFEEKVKLVKVFIVDSAGNVVGELKALENTYGIANFNILREQAATVLDNGGGFVGYEAQVKTVLLGTPNVELGADGTPTAVDTTYENVVDWGYMQDGKMTLKNKTETSNIRKDFVKRVKSRGRIPVVVIRFGSQTMAVPVALKGTPSNEGSKHKEALEESNDNTAKKVIDLNADLIARGSSQRFYFNNPTDQNVYNQDGSLSSEVIDAVEFLDNYEVTPDISTMEKDAAMSSVNSPVNFDNKPFISPKVILNFDKMYKIGERTPEVTEAKEATEKASKEAVKVVEKVKALDENNLKYKDTQFAEVTLLNHVKSGTIFMYQGMEGTLDTDGQRLIFTSGNQEFDLGYAPDLTLLELKNLGLERAEAMSVEITQDGNIVFNGETYTQDPSIQTVTVDGQDRYVTLKSSNGLYVTFQGDKADAIAYGMAKQEFTNKDITDEQGKEIAKQAREATVTKRNRKVAPKAEDTDSKSSVIVTTTKKEAQEVVEELKPLDGAIEEVTLEAPAKRGGKKAITKGASVKHKGASKKVKSVVKNPNGSVKRIELEDGTRLGKPVNPTQQETSPVSTIIDRLKKNGLASAVYEVTTEQLNEELANRANTPVRNQLPLMEVQDLGEVIGTGVETVVRRKGDKVYKVYDVAVSKMYSDESEFITSMEAQAQAFPEMGTMVVGKTEKGEYVVEQNYVTGATPTKEQLTEFMESRGFVYSDGTWKRDGFEFDDVTPHNAFIRKDGTVVVYDANVYRGEDFDARYQIIGQQGAEALDRIEGENFRAQNLQLAERLEEEGKSESDIWIATGWERGADGLWRYEIPDGEYKEVTLPQQTKNETIGTTGYEVTLGDIYDNPTLYEIYPGLRDIRVFIGHAPSDMSTVKMAYSYEDNLIFINKFYYGEAIQGEVFSLSNFRESTGLGGVLIHEIQHYIQNVEGFTGGSIVGRHRDEAVRIVEAIRRGDIQAIGETSEGRALQRRNEVSDNEYFRELASLGEDAAIRRVSLDIYKQTAGEVEARNVQRRLTTDNSLRRYVPLSVSEDIERDSQILPAQGNRFQLIGEQSTGLTPTRDVQVYITPATIRSFNEETLRLKELTNEYSNLAKEISQGNLENQEEFTNLQHKILDAYQEHIQDKVSKIRGVNVNFNQPYLGSWQGDYEPSLNMTLSISPNADTGAISGLLFDIAENTSQDSFILEERSEIEDRTPLTEFDEAGMMHYPQIRVNFNSQLSVEEKSIIAQRLNTNGVEDFSIDGDYFIVSIIDDNSETNEQKEQYYAEKAAAITTPFRGEGEKIGTNKVRDVQEHIRKSRYVGARNDGDAQSQTREYNRSDLFETQSPNTRYQIIGQQGASNLDVVDETATRIDNLQIAMKMLSEGKTTEETRLATGWELGADGEFRYEIMDGQYKSVKLPEMTKVDSVGTFGYEFTLEDIYDSPELYNAYPDARNIRVFLAKPSVELSQTFMAYNKEDNLIYINLDKYGESVRGNEFEIRRSTYSREVGGAINHEIQHYIQNIEGFEGGANSRGYIRQAKRVVDSVRGGDIESLGDTHEGRVLQEWVRDDANRDFLDRIESLPYNAAISATAFRIYATTAGEVEARNVQKRLEYTQDIRLNTPLYITEDVPRSIQLSVTDLSGNQTEVDSSSIITYESEVGQIHYIVDSNGDMQMVRLGQQTAPQGVSTQRLDKVTIKGAVTGSNEVFINTDLATQDTPIHEFAHIYNTWLQQNRPELWNKGKSLIEAELNKENSEIKEVIDYVKATQPTLTGDALVDEIMAELVGRRGVELINSKSKGGVINWIKDVWAEIAKMLGLSQMNPTQVANLTIKEYADAMGIDLLSGRDLKKQKRFIIKPTVTPADTKVNSRNRPATAPTSSLFTQNRSYSRKEAPTITTAYISEYNPFMTLKDKIKSVRLLGYDTASNKGKVLVNFADGSPSVEYSNVAFNRKEVYKATSNSSIPDGVDVNESKSFVTYHFRESFLNEGEESVKNYFRNLVENENMIKFANENVIYRFSDGQLRNANGEYLPMDYTRPFSLSKETDSPLSIRKQNTIILSEELRRQSKIEQNRDC